MCRILELIGLCTWYFVFHHLEVAASAPEPTKCHQACHKTDPNKINIHMIAHTHDDVGWLKTVDQYYYGSNKNHAQPGVQYILDSVTSELIRNRDRRFSYVEVAYFWAWWDELNPDDRAIVKSLVDEGRLEFLHGGWCMSDEATPHYSAMIDQMTLGLKFLNETFGECGRPTAAWQIDPFGHSSEVAIEFAEMGFDGLFVGRIDYDDHRTRKKSKTMEMVWKPDTSLGEAGELFFSVLYDLYTAPPGFCFDIFCNDEPVMDNKKLHGYNVEDRVKKFETVMKDYSSAYKSRHIAVTFGGDFTYTVGSAWFNNMDKLIKYTNNHSDFHLLYSTPSCYLQAINSQNLTWPTMENDDFFPYASDEHSYWTGYFTSRPAFKYYVYLSNNILQATKQMAILIDENLMEEEFYFKRALAIAQHHDGVSGTEKQHVVDDYALYLDEGLERGKKIITGVLRTVYGEQDYPEQNFCTLRNISQCNISEEGQSFVITVYNPVSRKVSFPVKVPVIHDYSYRIYTLNGNEVTTDLILIPESVSTLPGRTSKATHDLVFIAKDIPALGVTSFYVEVEKGRNNPTDKNVKPVDDTIVLDNGLIKLIFNKTSGLLQSVSQNGVTWPLHQNFYFYNATKGYNYNADSRASGAYIFRPTSAEPQIASPTATISQYHGNDVFEVYQKFNSWISQVVRLYKNTTDIEFEWVIGEIPINDWTGLEVVTKYTTDVLSNNTFYTDSNGRRWVKRIRDYRKYWNLSLSTETVSRNYYPLTSAICLRDSTKQITVLTDRPEGGTSMHSGEIEIMLHRRLLYDDNKGVVEPLDESAFGKGLVVRGRHTLQINNITAAEAAHRLKAVQFQYAGISTLSNTSFTRDQWLKNYGNKNFSVISTELPPNVHILTLERWRKGQVLIRLEHLFQADESPEYARPVTVDIKDLFAFFKITKIQELSLGANWEKDKLKRLKWHSQGASTKVSETKDTSTITLQPMQIRTFLLDIEQK